jgi:DNA polymerase III alpha subunit
MTKIANTDIDIDFKDRTAAINSVGGVVASIWKNDENKFIKHNTGLYMCDIPTDPFTGIASIEYKEAEQRGYIKIDFLNVSIYQHIRDENHLNELLEKPVQWDLLLEKDFIDGSLTGEPIFQIHDQYNIIEKIKPQSIDDLALTIALMRPGKRHLINEPRNVIDEEIWKKELTDEYSFKKSHSYSYALAIVVQINSIIERFMASDEQG